MMSNGSPTVLAGRFANVTLLERADEGTVDSVQYVERGRFDEVQLSQQRTELVALNSVLLIPNLLSQDECQNSGHLADI